jgi:hypothetical protein
VSAVVDLEAKEDGDAPAVVEDDDEEEEVEEDDSRENQSVVVYEGSGQCSLRLIHGV